VPEVRVIGDDGEQLGVMNTREAVRLAREKGLDLVEVAATAEPPVCRIIDFGKFQYETKKKANEAKKKQVTITVKEVKFRPGTDDHDYNFKMRHARQWLEEGDKVKGTIFFRGREITHRELGSQLLERLEKDLTDVGEVEARPRMEGNQMFLIFSPKKHKTGGGQQKPAAPRPPQPAQPQPGQAAQQQPAQAAQQQPTPQPPAQAAATTTTTPESQVPTTPRTGQPSAPAATGAEPDEHTS
jgi:translation initiation factor IF-3